MKNAVGRSIRGWLIAVLALLPLLPAGAVAAPADPSPATGHAQVIAQGIAELPAEKLVWRLDTPAAAAEEPDTASWATGFALATRGPILLTGGDDTGARLAPGEAAFVPPDSEITAQSLAGRRVRFARIELLPADQIEDDRADFVSDSFDAPAGSRDLDLVRDLLAAGERTDLPESDAPILVYATAGDLRLRTADGTTTIDAGDAAAVNGPVRLTASDDGDAAFVAALVGPSVGTADEPAPAPAPTDATGSIQIRFFGCGPDAIGQTEIDAERCEPLTEEIGATITGESSGTTLTLADARSGGGLVISYEWPGLPLDTYTLSDVVVPTGYDGVVVDPLDQVVELSEDAPDAVFVVFAIDAGG